MNSVIFSEQILVNFGDSDPQGFMYFSRALELAHVALEKYWSTNARLRESKTSSAHGWNLWFKNPEFAVPLKHAECDFLKPMLAGETYQLNVILSSIGETSVTFDYEFLASDVFARAKTVHVFVDRKNFNKISVPESIRHILTAPATFN